MLYFNLLGEGKLIETAVLHKPDAIANSVCSDLPERLVKQGIHTTLNSDPLTTDSVIGRLNDYMRSMVSTYGFPLVSQKLV